MPEQFTVPQFIDSEDKIFGPLTARQFIILMVTFLTMFGLFKLASFLTFLLTGVPLFVIAIIFAFARVNGVAFHYFVLDLVITFKKPRLRIWNKVYTDAQLNFFIKEKPPVAPERLVRKAAPVASRLKELTLVVDTGGVYKPDEDEV
jgi:hypothetical protein